MKLTPSQREQLYEWYEQQLREVGAVDYAALSSDLAAKGIMDKGRCYSTQSIERFCKDECFPARAKKALDLPAAPRPRRQISADVSEIGGYFAEAGRRSVHIGLIALDQVYQQIMDADARSRSDDPKVAAQGKSDLVSLLPPDLESAMGLFRQAQLSLAPWMRMEIASVEGKPEDAEQARAQEEFAEKLAKELSLEDLSKLLEHATGTKIAKKPEKPDYTQIDPYE